MKAYERRVGLLVLTSCIVLALTGQTWPLNPLVKRNAQPAGPVPVECEQGLAPAPAPRVNVAEIPEREIVLTAATIPAPPSRSLRGELEAAQTALARNDRPAFDRHLAGAKDLLENYPTGAERSAAQDVVVVLDDASRVWDAQFESPFFGEDSNAYARVSRYPGYADAVRRSMLVDDADHRFYPAAESRDFLTRVSAQHLNRLGIHATTRTPTTRIARATKPATTPRTTKQRSTPPAPRRTTPRREPKAMTKSKPAASPAPAPRSPDRAKPVPAAAEPAPAAPPQPTPRASVVPAAPPVADVAPAPITTTTTATTATTSSTPIPSDTAPPATASSATTSITETTDTTESQPPATTTTAEPPERRSVVVPALLILIGLGVLIVLFRASK